jgi:hypothetical protein
MKVLTLILAYLLAIISIAMIIKFFLTGNQTFIYIGFLLIGASAAAFGIAYGEHYKERYEELADAYDRHIQRS